ncbi:MAG TPA: CaiB/BaiF CoA-transferase family protein, partial [Sporosarcina sp.]|nr:CaiB/BaiF CoA-transferase family protein [Sporosarcina sp.]
MKMLEGIKILDVTYYLPGPYASMRLAEMGADVIKVEPPEGDPARTLSGGVVHRANNKGKQFRFLDLKSEVGKEEMLELIRGTDVLIESFRPGVMERLGFGYKTCAAYNPGLIYCSMTGYGQTGPIAECGSHDLNYMALSGLLSQLTDQQGHPIHPRNTIADYVGAMAVTEAILAALVQRGKTGKGAYLDVSITDALQAFQGTHRAYAEEGLSNRGIPEIDGSYVSYGIYETKDKRHVVLAALEPKFWRNFCAFAERPDWLEHNQARIGSEIHREIEQSFAA